MSARIPPVVIVGAGPTGMTAALDLAHYGIPSLLLDEDHTLSEGSRALAYHESALGVWEKLNATGPMLQKGIAWSRRHTYHGKRLLYTQDYAHPPAGFLPRYINLPQVDVERALLERIRPNPLITLRWDHKVTGVSQTETGVNLTVETPHGETNLQAAYALACDGARSAMRRLLGLDFPGQTFNDHFLIADIRADLNFPHEPRFFFNHPSTPGQTVLIHPQPNGVWRIDWQIGAQANAEQEMQPNAMARRIRALIGDTPYETVWLSAYRFHQRLLARLRHGRILFAGDSAHLVAPFGARGMNSAIQDVENLGWKLSLVLRGLAPQSLLETYHTERWAAQHENQRVTITTMKFMAPNTPWLRLKRDLILWLSGFYAPARRRVDSGKMSVPFTYAPSALCLPDNPTDAWGAAPGPGSKPPDAAITVIHNGQPAANFLRRLFGSGFVALFFEDDSAPAADIHRALEASRAASLPLAVYTVTRSRAGHPQAIHDPQGQLAGMYSAQPGALVLFRPDGHIALRRQKAHPQDLAGYFSALCGPPNTP